VARSDHGPVFFYILLTVAAVLVAIVARPIATGLFLACVLAGVLQPLQQRMKRFVRRPALASIALVVAVVVVLLAPIVALSSVAVSEAAGGVRYVKETLQSEGVAGLVDRLPPSARHLASSALERLSADSGGDVDKTVQDKLQSQGGRAAAVVGAVAVGTGALLFQTAIMLIALYFLLVDGKALVDWLDRTVPLRPGELRELLGEFRRVARAVIVSSVVTAGVQALAALAGYAMTGVPNPLFFTGVTFFVALIPAVGATVVCLVAALLLWFGGHSMAALVLAGWGLGVVGTIDNIVKPFVASNDLEMHGAIVFFALIGGIAAFGAVGLLIGPLVANLFITLTTMYRRSYKGGRRTT
jgi:predicted PurR-regulated permease PerM